MHLCLRYGLTYPSNALPPNTGYLIGFGRGFDPTETTKLTGNANVKLVRGYEYCASGN